MRSRDYRRAEHRKALARARAAYPDLPAKQHQVLARTPKPCSCWMCGNRRRHHKGDERNTVQERRADVAAHARD